MNVITFDVSAIISISFYKERESYYYRWQEPQPLRNWWGIKNGKFTDAGWIDVTDIFHNTIYTEERITKKGLRIDADKKVYDAPYIIINLINGDKIRKTFKTDLEATEYISILKEKSGKIFETIVYN